MWEFSVFRALGLMVRTLPFLLFRSAVCLTVAAALALAAAAGATAGRLLEGEGPGFGAQWGASAGPCWGFSSSPFGAVASSTASPPANWPC
jgi:hypothetical protein